METRKALELAQQAGLDLAEVSPTANPPVCKILDYGKYKYELKKKAKVSKKNQVIILLKEVQFRPQTDTHDIDFKTKHILRFLGEGNKVKVSVRFRGREASHADLGYVLLRQIVDTIGASGIVEQTAKMEGKILSLIMSPATKAAVKKTVAAVVSKPLVNKPKEETARPVTPPASGTKAP